jgi:hypothetical protein
VISRALLRRASTSSISRPTELRASATAVPSDLHREAATGTAAPPAAHQVAIATAPVLALAALARILPGASAGLFSLKGGAPGPQRLLGGVMDWEGLEAVVLASWPAA